MTGDKVLFPRVKTMGVKNIAGDRNNSNEFLKKYYNQLTQDQIEKLYNLYKTDFEMFGYEEILPRVKSYH